MREQPNIFAARITLGAAATCQKPSYAHFHVHVSFVQYTSRTLSVDFRCSDSKDSQIHCSLFTNSKYRNDNIPDLKMQFDFFPKLFISARSSLKLIA